MARTLIELGDDQKEALDRLSDELGHSKADIMRAGLFLIRMACIEARRGNGIGIVNGERTVKEIVGVWNNLAPAGA